MRVFVTGIEGFLGRRLAAQLRAAGDEVGGSHLASAAGIEGCRLYEADLLDRTALGAAIDDFRPEAVIHLAGYSHVGQSWRAPGSYFQVNVLGTENALAAVPEGVAFVFASSAEVYGMVEPEELPLVEDRRPAPVTPYGLTKAAAERLVLARGGIVVRSFNLLGAGQDRQFALPGFARQLARIAAGAEPVVKVGNLEARRDFLHVEDGAAGYRCLLRQGAAPGLYNLASGEAISIEHALGILIELSGLEVGIERESRRLRPHEAPVLCGSSRRLQALGWRPERTLRDALGELWQEARAEVGIGSTGE